MPALFDAHCHLQDLPAAEVKGVLDRAGEAGISRMACCATSEADWEPVLALAAAHPQVVPMLGIHPWRIAEVRPGWEARLDALLHQHRAGIGECGLDFARRGADRESQLNFLRLHLRLSAKHPRPVAIHCVRAWGPLKTLLAEEGPPPAGVLVHAFGGSPETALELQAWGCFLSFSPRLMVPGAETQRLALGAVREDRLLLESDAPGPGKAEPADLPALLDLAATLRGCTPEHLAEVTVRNAERLFRGALA